MASRFTQVQDSIKLKMKRKEVCLAGIECASLEGIWYIWLGLAGANKEKKKKKTQGHRRTRTGSTHLFIFSKLTAIYEGRKASC
jgi:hypothetical protein